MIETNYYKVAGHRFCVKGEAAVFTQMENYEPFICEAGEVVFTLSVDVGQSQTFTEELRQKDEEQEIVCGRTADGLPVYEFRWWKETAGRLVCSVDNREGKLVRTGRYEKMALDNALMVLFALATAHRDTVLFHASVVSHGGQGFMFLGPSGTGKSTHSSLWLRYILGTILVNDDNPVVTVVDGKPFVHGSPWSGKTPCYRNVTLPLGAIVVLSQAPYNRMEQIQGIQAYSELVPNISGKRWDSRIADGLHHTENVLVSMVPMFHLECLPDEAAVHLCFEKIKNETGRDEI